MKALISFETLATIHPTTRRHVPEYQDELWRVYFTQKKRRKKKKKKDFPFKLMTDNLL
jgi:hypothetical protein